MERQFTAMVVGCGDRAVTYCNAAKTANLPLRIIAAVDPDPERRTLMQAYFDVPEEMCFTDIDEVLRKGKIADCIINGTMDQLHMATTVPFLEQGYHILLEKPIVNNAEDLLFIAETAHRNDCKLMTCHVLRYAPFYRKAKELIDSGALGDIMHIETSERVGVSHVSVAYIRGKWKKESECGSTMLLAKCCHDIDLLCWLNNKSVPVMADSMGGRNFIVPEKAPTGAGTRCMVDCPAKDTCKYDAELIYLKNDTWQRYAWQCTGKNYWDVAAEERERSLMTDNPHGECAYKTNSDLVDHQTVMLQFADGSTATHTMLSGCAKAGRSLFISGTDGEIEGFADNGYFMLRHYDPKTLGYTETKIDFNESDGNISGGHYGGDARLVQDFIALLSGQEPSVSCTRIEDSLYGHLCVYAADEALRQGRRISVKL